MATRFERELTRRLRTIGRRISDARQLAELSQEEAAAQAGIDTRRWQRLEAGDVNMTFKTLLRISQVLDIDPAALIAMGGE